MGNFGQIYRGCPEVRKSPYFSDLINNYLVEIDDLVTDSEGRSVLQKRLNEKRRENSFPINCRFFKQHMQKHKSDCCQYPIRHWKEPVIARGQPAYQKRACY